MKKLTLREKYSRERKLFQIVKKATGIQFNMFLKMPWQFTDKKAQPVAKDDCLHPEETWHLQKRKRLRWSFLWPTYSMFLSP